LSDALISLIPVYGPWIIFGIVALESAGVPLPGEIVLVAASLFAARAAAGAIVGDGAGYMVGRMMNRLAPRFISKQMSRSVDRNAQDTELIRS
jgi:membrane protein DedA with SNARE-associated domain